jgi:hypothetical protein
MLHVTSIAGGQDAVQAKCNCKWRSPVGSRADAYAAELEHHRDVRRAQAGLRRTPSLRQEREWYLEQATNYANSREERELWQRLAEELSTRIAEPDLEQLPLW